MLVDITDAAFIRLRFLILHQFQLYELLDVDLDQRIVGQVSQVRIGSFTFESLQMLKDVVSSSG